MNGRTLIIMVLFSLLCLGAEPHQPTTQEAMEFLSHPHPRSSPFERMKDVMLAVEVVNTNEHFDQLTKDRLNTRSELVLRRNMVPLEAVSMNMLWIKVVINSNDHGTRALGFTEVGLYRYADLRDSSHTGAAILVPVWHRTEPYYIDSSAQSTVLDHLDATLEEFARDYLRWKSGVIEYDSPLLPTTKP
jgi:hypothetical protein